MGLRAAVPSVKPMSCGCCCLLCWGFQLWHRHITQLRAKVVLPLRKRQKWALEAAEPPHFLLLQLLSFCWLTH